MNKEFFPPRPDSMPTIYAYTLKEVATHEGLIKVGYTSRNANDRNAEQLKTSRVGYEILL